MDIEEIIKEAFPYFSTMKFTLYDNLFSHHGKSFSRSATTAYDAADEWRHLVREI